MTFSKKWKKIFYSILEWNLDLKYYIPKCIYMYVEMVEIAHFSKQNIGKNNFEKTSSTNIEGSMCAKFRVSTTNGLGWAQTGYIGKT